MSEDYRDRRRRDWNQFYDYWDRRQKHMHDDHEFQRKQTQTDFEIFKTRVNINRLTDEINRRQRSDRLKTLRDQMGKEKQSVLTDISACSFVLKDRWYQHLEGIDMTGPDADAKLKNLREEVERERGTRGRKRKTIRTL
jgi:hypothetical protein